MLQMQHAFSFSYFVVLNLELSLLTILLDFNIDLNKMFYIIGIGLGDVKDITVKGLEIVKSAKRVYLESYTSILSVGKDALEEFYGRPLIIADRDLVEQDSDDILLNAQNDNVVLLVVGDPFSATTHTDLFLRAIKSGISCNVVHNASIINAIGCTGLQLYNFGETVSIPYWDETWQPDSFFNKICSNKKRGLHTLCLLDIRVKEPTLESLTKKKKEYQPPRFMTVAEAANQLIQIIVKQRVDGSADLEVNEESICVGVARVGASNQKMIVGTLQEMSICDLGTPLHSLVVVGYLHPVEKEYLENFGYIENKT